MLTCPVPTHETWNYRASGRGWFPHSPVLPLVVSWIVTLGFLTACAKGCLRKFYILLTLHHVMILGK